ncbi:MAG: ATP-binding protein, partial [Fibrobacterota bacterium]
EVLIGKKSGNEIVYLNPLRKDSTSILYKRIRIGDTIAIPVQRAVLGETGVAPSIDYRGRKVIAAWRYMPSLGWGLVAKIDSEEAFVSVTNLKHLFQWILGMMLALITVIVYFMTQSISQPIKRLSKGAEIIGSGNLDYQVGTNSKDEIGQLSRSFDKMTANLKTITASRDDLTRKVSERKRTEEALGHSASRFELIAKTANELLQTQEPQKAVETLCQNVMTRLDCHTFSNFLADEKTGKFHLNTYAGIPAQEAQRIEWLDYDADPVKPHNVKAYACHPLVSVDGKVIGTLSFGTQSRETFTDDELSLMKVVTDMVGVAIIRQQDKRALEQHAMEMAHMNKELEAFSYSVAHDLRNPLHSILLCAEILATDSGPALNKDAKVALNHIMSSANRMAQVITDLMTLSSTSRQSMNNEEIHLSEIAGNFMEELKSSDTSRKVRFDVKPGLTANGDPGLIRILLENLIRNAWKFTSTRTDAHIEFGALEKDGRECYFIRDNGVGFNQKDADRMFTPFQRLHSQKEFKGTGIGLAIVQRIAVRHGGNVWAEGEQGKGATINFCLS